MDQGHRQIGGSSSPRSRSLRVRDSSSEERIPTSVFFFFFLLCTFDVPFDEMRFAFVVANEDEIKYNRDPL